MIDGEKAEEGVVAKIDRSHKRHGLPVDLIYIIKIHEPTDGPVAVEGGSPLEVGDRVLVDENFVQSSKGLDKRLTFKPYGFKEIHDEEL